MSCVWLVNIYITRVNITISQSISISGRFLCLRAPYLKWLSSDPAQWPCTVTPHSDPQCHYRVIKIPAAGEAVTGATMPAVRVAVNGWLIQTTAPSSGKTDLSWTRIPVNSNARFIDYTFSLNEYCLGTWHMELWKRAMVWYKKIELLNPYAIFFKVMNMYMYHFVDVSIVGRQTNTANNMVFFCSESWNMLTHDLQKVTWSDSDILFGENCQLVVKKMLMLFSFTKFFRPRFITS